MYVKSIKMSLEVTFILFQFMPFIWERLIVQLPLERDSEVHTLLSSTCSSNADWPSCWPRHSATRP